MQRLRKAAFAALLVVEIAVQYGELPFLRASLGSIALVVWALALVPADKISRMISLTLIAIGSILFVKNGAPLEAVIGSFAENTSVLMVMTLIPLLGVAVELGGYAEALATASESITNPRTLHVMSVLLAFAIGAVMLNASIALLWVVLFPVVERMVKEPKWFLATSLPRGYDAALIWTPSSPSTAVALSVSGAAWTSIAGPGLATGLVVLALAIISEWRHLGAVSASSQLSGEGGKESAATQSNIQTPVDTKTKRKLAGLAAGLISFISTIILTEAVGITIYQAVLPCVLLTLFVWTGLLGKIKEGAGAAVRQLDGSLTRMSTQFLLMTTAGFIGTAVKFATAGGLPGYMGALVSNRLVFALVVPVMVVFLSIVCVHPQIGMVITYSLLASTASAYPPAFVCVALLLGAAMGFNVSPVSATMLVTSACANTNSIEVGLKRHWRYVAVALPLGALALYAVSGL